MDCIRTELDHFLKKQNGDYKKHVNKSERKELEEYWKREETLPSTVMQELETIFGTVDADMSSSSSSDSRHRSRSAGRIFGKDAYESTISGWIYSKVDHFDHSRQGQQNAFASKIYNHLASKLNEQQNKLAENIWKWREEQMEVWLWVLGLTKDPDNNARD